MRAKLHRLFVYEFVFVFKFFLRFLNFLLEVRDRLINIMAEPVLPQPNLMLYQQPHKKENRTRGFFGCFICGQLTHWARDCPIRGPPAQIPYDYNRQLVCLQTNKSLELTEENIQRMQEQASLCEQNQWLLKGAKKSEQGLWRSHDGRLVAPAKLCHLLNNCKKCNA